ncbi:sugar ABC transporter substrate-binding protein [Paenarthrobacter aromaticivorans]|uniref:Substrate-binding domain-containing protein n=1 Tax=Paenarthrobacter aromaticivorans TaxID=2849150 RepID=A0ABS6HZ84_9MICC|nr:substrate-binding domain-containing protein [Paenarthrobacter sp. MMS21-TAE1-1]MBU8864806.1 substrate-binding domain-containing protein [Paenarthrobacter sp. MMS21-TAE1-1]
MFRRRNPNQAGAVVAVFTCLVALITGCGPAATTQSSAQDSGASSAFTAKVAADVATATAAQTASTNPVPATSDPIVHGKKIVVIPCSMAVEGCARPARSIIEAAHLLGWEASIDDPASDSTKISAAIQRAVSKKADAIALTSIDAAAVQGDIKAARDAGIAVTCNMCGNKDDLYESMVPSLDENNKAGYLLGEFAYLEARKRFNSAPKFIVLTDPEFDTVKARVSGLKQFIDDCKAAGAGCEKVAEGSFLAGEISTVAPGRVAQLVRSNPGYNVMFAGFDAAMLFFSQGLQQAGLADTKKAFGISVDADVANTEMIRKGGFQAASVGFAFGRAGYGHVDNLNRLFDGQAPVDQGVTGKLVTKDNVPGSGGWDGDFDATTLYKHLWKVG